MSAALAIKSPITCSPVRLIVAVAAFLAISGIARAAPEGGSSADPTPSALRAPLRPLQDGAPPPASAIPITPALIMPPTLSPELGLGKDEVLAEMKRLRQSLAAEVPHLVPQTPESEQRWIARTQAQLLATRTAVLRPQLVVVVDRAPKIQQLALMVAQPDAPYEVLGVVHVSTGQAGRFDHYVTPTGVFRHTDAILDYRAQGTYNENHIRGLGLKGMRVWDFGWQWARKGWTPDPGKPLEIQIRLEMHATDPAVLEQRIGRTASQGCVRIPSAMNRFLDMHGVLDATYEQAAISDIRYRALLLPHRTVSALAGEALIIIDSSAPPGAMPDQHPGPDSGAPVNLKGAAVTVSGKSS